MANDPECRRQQETTNEPFAHLGHLRPKGRAAAARCHTPGR